MMWKQNELKRLYHDTKVFAHSDGKNKLGCVYWLWTYELVLHFVDVLTNDTESAVLNMLYFLNAYHELGQTVLLSIKMFWNEIITHRF